MKTVDREKLWESYQKNPVSEIREQIIIEYAPLVKLVAGRLSMYLGYNVEYEDLVSYGIFGLIDAIDKFDRSKDVKFETYASLRIRKQMFKGGNKFMEFGYSKEQVLLREMYKKFAETEIKPLAEELDEEERFPVESIPKLARYGFMGIPFPKEYGGAGGNYLTYAMAVEELGKVCATTAVIVSAHTSLCAGPIYYFGTEEQKQKYLVPLAKGEKIGAFGLTEPSAGTDSSMQQTTAVLDGDEYVLNGTKVFITNAGYADIYVVIAMTDKSKGNKGISAFIVEKGTPGFSVMRQRLNLEASSVVIQTPGASCLRSKSLFLSNINRY